MNTEKLKKLLQDSLLITSERRDDILKHLDTLTDEQIQAMENAIVDANFSLKNTIANAMENSENQEKVETFNQGIDQIWKKYTQDTEKASDEIENAEAENLLTNL